MKHLFDTLLILSAIPLSLIASVAWQMGIRPRWLRNLNDEAEWMERAILGSEQDRAH
jgi:hypothetical protein